MDRERGDSSGGNFLKRLAYALPIAAAVHAGEPSERRFVGKL